MSDLITFLMGFALGAAAALTFVVIGLANIFLQDN